MENFKVGKTYFTRSICDHETIFKIKVVRRTAKLIVIEGGKRLYVALDHDGVESVKPHGTYSMCAVISADRELIVEDAPQVQAAPVETSDDRAMRLRATFALVA